MSDLQSEIYALLWSPDGEEVEEYSDLPEVLAKFIEQLVSERTKALREALADCMPLMEFYLQREIGHPANHQEFAREKRELRDRLRAILKDGQP